MDDRLFSTAQWVAWIGATLSAVLVASAFAFTTFATKEEAKESKADLTQRLSRIEDKLDQVLERNR